MALRTERAVLSQEQIKGTLRGGHSPFPEPTVRTPALALNELMKSNNRRLEQ